jgi:small GTP-binding protein
MSTMLERLNLLLDNYFVAVDTIEMCMIFDRNGLLITKKSTGRLMGLFEQKVTNNDEIYGAITGLVERTLLRITNEYAIGAFGTGSFETESHRLVFTEAGPQAILLSIFQYSTELNSVLPYCFLVAEKVSCIIEGKFTEQHSLTIPNLELGFELGINPSTILRTPLKYDDQNVAKRTEMRYKLIVLGNAGVGKTSLINQFVTKKFYNDYRPTLGISITSQVYNVQGFDEAKINFMIWDVAGQKFFQRVRKHYYQQAHAAFIMYDVTNKQTFEDVEMWHEDIRAELPSIPFVIIGNKIDLNDKRVISRAEGVEKAKRLKCSFMETSAKTGENVMDAFNILGIGLFFKSK